MGKKGSNKKALPATTSGPQMSVTIREASTGKKHTNVKSSLKLQHIKNLAMWATHDASIPSLGAFFGHHFAASSEALGMPVDPSLFTCERCESILHPGHNCTVRIETNKTNARHKGKKSKHYPRNNIVYTCHFCSQRNIKRGTPRNTCPPKAHKRVPEPASSTNQKTRKTVSFFDRTKNNVVANTVTASLGSTGDDPRGKMGIAEVKDDPAASGPGTPLNTMTLLESKMKKRNRSGAKKTTALESVTEKSVNTSNRRRRKSWSSLKEIAESNDNNKRLMNLTVPFSIGI
ncbi:uncharacterized protein LOC112529869 [Cynara cardunculus var. scolymus]|uniref:uncharacterized protein LOC112529869 n=1 Tax=Cynara cardunculus var. scolymus TaxID=59895 RepID=UPI000D6254A6|nr:uncharacterized protein LOC112529869 [Cynara cardunculus var. scolymus]